jgi:polysaccharide export outer membrane protein
MIRALRTLALPLVGLLVSCTPTPLSAQVDPPLSPGDVLLSPGDVLRITVWRHPELSGEYTVAADSTLLHPLYQSIKVAGVPPGVAKERLRGLLTSYEQDVQLTLEPLFPVSVAGEVRQPNLYRLPEGTTIAQAVAIAGGPTERGRLDRIHVLRGHGEIRLDLTSDAARSEKVLIASGDQILVGRRSQFNFLRDFFVPLVSLSGTVAAIINVTRH